MLRPLHVVHWVFVGVNRVGILELVVTWSKYMNLVRIHGTQNNIFGTWTKS